MHRATGQKLGLTPMQATKVARGYRASAVELKQVVNEKGETVGRLNDFILGKDGNNYVILAIDDFTGLTGELVAVPFKNLKLDDPSGNTVLPGASNANLTVANCGMFKIAEDLDVTPILARTLTWTEIGGGASIIFDLRIVALSEEPES